jgi:uncharacterized membrane protein HdeD (DUF308 family)
MERKYFAILLILLGLIVLAFPLLGLIPLSIITGFIITILGTGLLLGGIAELSESTSVGILGIILGIIALILGFGFMFSPGLFSWVAGFIIWVVGLLLIIQGIMGVFLNTGGFKWKGVISIIAGVIYIIIGNFIKDPVILGVLIGLWLLISGIIMLFVKE